MQQPNKKQSIAILGMCLWSIGVATLLAFKFYDWKSAIFFDVPLIFLSRYVWTNISIGKDGITLSDSTIEVGEALKDIKSFENKLKANVELRGNISTQEVKTPRLDKALEAFSNDDVMIFAALRIEIEKLIKRMIIIADIGECRAIQTLNGKIAELSRGKFLSSDLANSLGKVLEVSNQAIHSLSITATNSERKQLINMGQSLLSSLELLPSNPTWLALAICNRASMSAISARITSSPDLHMFVTIEVEGNTIEVERSSIVLKNEPSLGDGKDSTVILTHSPNLEIIGHAVQNDYSLAWLDYEIFKGTPKAIDRHPWIFYQLDVDHY
jgi:hypothetical protein